MTFSACIKEVRGQSTRIRNIWQNFYQQYVSKEIHSNELGTKMFTEYMWRLLSRYLQLCEVHEVQNTIQQNPQKVMKTAKNLKDAKSQNKNFRNQTTNIKNDRLTHKLAEKDDAWVLRFVTVLLSVRNKPLITDHS